MISLKTAKINEPIALFLVGVQCRSFLSLWRLPWIGRQMVKIQEELKDNPDSGFLWGENFLSFSPMTTLFLSYWKSADHIKSFANDPHQNHRPAWTEYIRRFYDHPHFGVWHETYVIDPKNMENIYAGMPPFGISGFGTVENLSTKNRSFEGRLKENQNRGNI